MGRSAFTEVCTNPSIWDILQEYLDPRSFAQLALVSREIRGAVFGGLQAASSQALAFKLQPDDSGSVELFIKEISNLVKIPATLRYRPLVSYALQISRVPLEQRTNASDQWLAVYKQTPVSTMLNYIATRVVQAKEHPLSVLRLAVKEGVISLPQFCEQYIIGKEAKQWLDKIMQDWLTSAWTRSIGNARLAAVSRATGAAGLSDLVQQARLSFEEQNTPQHDLI